MGHAGNVFRPTRRSHAGSFLRCQARKRSTACSNRCSTPPRKTPRSRRRLRKPRSAAEKELIKPLFEFHNNGRPVGNGWTSPPNGARWGTDYLSRTATARSNMFDNAPERDPLHLHRFRREGQRLDGANRYSVTFAAACAPPVNGFWSLTVYNKEHLFEPNALNRFSLGHKEQVDEVQRGRLARRCTFRTSSGDRQGIELGADTQG